MSPERARGENPVPACDLWSLGATLYAMTEGIPPFRRQSQLLTLTAVIHDPTPPAVHAGPLQSVIGQMLAKDRSERPDADRTRQLLQEVKARLLRDSGPSVPVSAALRLRGLPSRPASRTVDEPLSVVGTPTEESTPEIEDAAERSPEASGQGLAADNEEAGTVADADPDGGLTCWSSPTSISTGPRKRSR